MIDIEKEREAFEAWWPTVGQTIGKVAAEEAWLTRAARAERAEAAQRVPDGWRLVPDSATHRMLNAANTGRKKGCSSSGAIYAAMLAAAPDAPQAAQRVPLTEETEFEVWQDDELQASALGPRAYAWQEALRYAAQYAKDGVVRVFEVSRREVGITSRKESAMHSTPIETLTARTAHWCTSCGEQINPGERYKRWRSYDGGDASTNKMHPECLSMHEESARIDGESWWEYVPFSHERPRTEAGHVA